MTTSLCGGRGGVSITSPLPRSYVTCPFSVTGTTDSTLVTSPNPGVYVTNGTQTIYATITENPVGAGDFQATFTDVPPGEWTLAVQSTGGDEEQEQIHVPFTS